MSWSIYISGHAGALRNKVKEIAESPSFKCAEPEEAARQAAIRAIDATLTAYPVKSAVRIAASGSMTIINGSSVSAVIDVKVENLYGFVE